MTVSHILQLMSMGYRCPTLTRSSQSAKMNVTHNKNHEVSIAIAKLLLTKMWDTIDMIEQMLLKYTKQQLIKMPILR